MSRAFARPLRGVLHAAIVLGVCLLALPLVVVLSSDTAELDVLWTSLRIAGLEAFTVLFVDLTLGAFRPFFSRVVGPFVAHRVHVITGAVGFALAASHGGCVLVFGISGYPAGAVWIGPGVLLLLAAVIVTALLRTRLRSSWRQVHRLNYALFLAAFLHAMVLGSDLSSNRLLLVCAFVYAAVAVGGYGYRLSRRTHTRHRHQP